MRETCRRYVDTVVRPFIAENREREWLFDPDARLPPAILDKVAGTGLRELGIPDKYGGVSVDPSTEVPHLRRHRHRACPRRRRARRQALAELEDRRPAPRARTRAPAGRMVLPLHERSAVPDGPLPHRAEGGLGPVASLQRRPRRQHGHPGRARGRAWTINGRKQFISNGYDAPSTSSTRTQTAPPACSNGTSSFLVPRDDAGARGDEVQRDRRRPFHEQRRDRLRRLPRPRGPHAGPQRRPRQGRRLLQAGQDPPGGKEPRHRVGRLRGHGALRPGACSRRACDHQAPSGGGQAGDDGRRSSRRSQPCSTAPPTPSTRRAPTPGGFATW